MLRTHDKDSLYDMLFDDSRALSSQSSLRSKNQLKNVTDRQTELTCVYLQTWQKQLFNM